MLTFDVEALGNERFLGGWDEKGGTAAEFELPGGHNYRVYRPTVTATSDGGLRIFTKMDHIRAFADDDHVALTLVFDGQGRLVDGGTSDVQLAGETDIPAQSIGTIATTVFGPKAGAIAAASAEIFEKLHNALTGDSGGRLLIADVVASVADLIGRYVGVGSDDLYGTTGNDRIEGLHGNDVVRGGDGADLLFGGWDRNAPGDMLNRYGFYGFDGYDTLVGGTGDDTLVAASWGDRLEGGEGVDTVDITGLVPGDALAVSLETGQVLTYYSDDPHPSTTILVGIENVVGSEAAETLSGDTNDNHLAGRGGQDVIAGRAGHDTLDGGEGNDWLVGEAGSDHLLGGRGDDTLVSAGDGDTLDGGEGIDLADYRTAASVSISIGTGAALNLEHVIASYGSDRVTGDGGANRIQGMGGADDLRGGANADTLDGGDGDDTLGGGEGDDSLVGGGGDNVFEGNAGNDVLVGGAEFDTVDYGLAAGPVSVDLAFAGPQQTGEGIDTLLNIEALRGSLSADTLGGTDGANLVEGRGGADMLAGRGGADTLLGGDGNDTLLGGEGDDLLDGGESAGDRVSYAAATGAVRVSLALAEAQNTGGAGTDLLAGVEQLIGSAFDDVLRGDAAGNVAGGGLGDDRLIGGGGDDALFGGRGADTMFGSAGDDTLDGGGGRDIASYLDSATGVSVSLAAAGAQDTGGGGTDLLIGMEDVGGSDVADTLEGDDRGNFLGGRGGDDLIRGRGGDDTLHGGAGLDTVVGGAGADVFRFVGVEDDGPPRAVADRVADFERGVDRIDLSLFDANLRLDGLQHFRGALLDGDDRFTKIRQIQVTEDAGTTWIGLEVDGDDVADAFITLKGRHDLSIDDFILG